MAWSPTHGIAECVRGRRGRRPSGVEVGAGSGAALNPSPYTHLGEGNVLGPASVLFPLTLTLSLGEREKPRPLSGHSSSPRPRAAVGIRR